jgi:tetratricopeptide (TPR) repeat protein
VEGDVKSCFVVTALTLVTAMGILVGCSSPEPQQKPEPKKAPETKAPEKAPDAKLAPGLYDDLGTHHRKVTTTNETAQKFFDQGLVLAAAFNHDESIRCFEQAQANDPACAMAFWGEALAYGPHINNTAMDERAVGGAWAALVEARKLADKASPVEKALIDALSKRYVEAPPADRSPLDKAYADAMREVAKAYPTDADVLALAAESIMNLHPWDLWTFEGAPKHDDTKDVLALLEKALAANPEHPLANHLFIHAMEPSSEPAKAKPSADRLRNAVPGAGHLVHMPGHIDIRTGRFDLAVKANEDAVAADKRLQERFPTPASGFYRAYMMHNHHFLAFAAMMDGRYKVALDAARAMTGGIPEAFIVQALPLVDGYMPVAFHVHLRFGRWNEVLDEPAFRPQMIVANSVRHYARGAAFAALGKLDEADAELAAFREEIKALDDRPIGNNPAKLVLQIPERVLEAEILVRRGNFDRAIELLREATKIEESFKYDEPPDWMTPSRHQLAAVLFEAKKVDEAQKVLEQDLVRFPENVWALAGLVRCAKARGDEAALKALEERHKKASARADETIDSSCKCLPAK